MRNKVKVQIAIKQLIDGNLLTPISQSSKLNGTSAILAQLELLRHKLVDASDQERELEEYRKTTIASVVHDLKTPLAVISGYAECLQDGIDDKDYLTLIQEKTTQMNDMVLHILEASRASATENLKTEKVSVRDFFCTELEKYRTQTAEKKIIYGYSDVPDVIVRLERTKIARIIQNLVMNAVQYTPEGGKIYIKFYIWQRQFCMEVRDNGSGIDRKCLHHIFDKFFREDTARSGSNSGLGLYISQEIANAHGGAVSVKSKKGKGSRFTLKLPFETDVQLKKKLFGRMPRLVKFLFLLLFGWFFCSAYRIRKFATTRHLSTLIAGFFAIPLFVFFWFIDMASVITYNTIIFIAD